MHLSLALILCAGCVTESTQPATTTLTAAWSVQDLATGRETGCPAGFDIARLVAMPTNGSPAVTTDFTCDDDLGESAPLTPEPYDASIEILAGDGTLYAQSLPIEIDLSTGADERLNTVILNDGGYAHLAWTFVGATSGAVLGCADGIDTIVVTAGPFVDQLACEDRAGLTTALAEGSYDFVVTAQQQGATLGSAQPIAGTIAGENRVTELGVVQVAITGR